MAAVPGPPNQVEPELEFTTGVPLLLIGYAQTDGSGIYPALWSAMLAARAEGVGSTLAGMLHSFHATGVGHLLGVPEDKGWRLHGVVAMGYPTAR